FGRPNYYRQGEEKGRTSVSRGVPKRGPTTIIWHPTPTKFPMKNGPKSRRFRHILLSLAALANRRLRRLGHLTVMRRFGALGRAPNTTGDRTSGAIDRRAGPLFLAARLFRTFPRHFACPGGAGGFSSALSAG